MWFFAIYAHSYSPTVVSNTKFTNADGKDVCLFETIEIEPLDTVDQPGKCQELTCDHEFNVIISFCFQDPYNRCHYEGSNFSLPYSECCGVRVCS